LEQWASATPLTDASGDLVPDAVLGAVAVEHGAGVATLDRDFARFSSVSHRRPTPGD
jgi:predicted nucleic acid-binding protein